MSLIIFQELSDLCFDAFAVVFSITDRSSYQTAVDQLYNLRYEQAVNNKPTILIANKIDLVRKRKVTKEGKVITSHVYAYERKNLPNTVE